MRLRDAIPRLGRCASTEMLMRPRMARGVVDANLHGKSEPPNGRDRLIQAQPNAPNEAIVEYQYDADDRRIARIETPRINGVPQAPITTLYVFDNSTLLHEANLAGITDTYRRSAKLDRHIAHATNTVRHYQLDALDTPVAMTDATGATVNATTFDAWGNPTQQTAAGTTTVPWQVPNYNPLATGQAALLNNDKQSIGFTGYQKDAATGLYYAGARFYDPLIGGFNGMDPAWGTATKPVTFHKYLYANGNPFMYVDPDGRVGFLTTLRNQFDDADAYFRLMAEQNPILAGQIGMARGAVSLVGGGVRGANLASDGVASLLDESYYGEVATQGRSELSETLDPVFRYAEHYARNPIKTAWQTNLAAATALAKTAVAAAGGDGGATSDIYSGATQLAVPALGARAGLFGATSEVTASVRVIDDVMPDTSVTAQTRVAVESTSATSVVADSAKPRFTYDARSGRYRHAQTGRFVAARNLPWPDNSGFASSTMQPVMPGKILDRFGNLDGRFIGEPGASVAERGMAQGAEGMAYRQLRVIKRFDARVGPAAAVPEFNANGGATQYLQGKTVQQLIDDGFLEEFTP
ncbi:MAG: glycohydrolase toxin TNT-related protein [Rhodanobacteraceae bacterium]|nr:glycohydrolase toxin TNT-related protein [Rhodanobacteraceae bacterium]